MEPSINWLSPWVKLLNKTADISNLPDGTLLYDEKIQENIIIFHGVPSRVIEYKNQVNIRDSTPNIYIEKIPMNFTQSISSLPEDSTKVIHRVQPTKEGWEDMV